MQTSKSTHDSPYRDVSHRYLALESLLVGAAAIALSVALSPKDAGLGTSAPHVGWLGVLIIAARYGTRGLIIALPFTSALLLGVAALFGSTALLQHRIEIGSDLGAMVAAVVVAWVSSVGERRLRAMAGKLVDAQKRSANDAEMLHELQEALLAMRARTDRLEVSLSFLRDVAERLGGADAHAAAEAALELAMARIGARAGTVQLRRPEVVGDAEVLAATGAWSDGSGSPGNVGDDLTNDLTIAAALKTRRAVRAIDLGQPRAGDADIAAPLLDHHGEPIGFVAVRGVPYAGASLATLRDLAIVSDWLSRALARAGTTASPGLESHDSFEHGLLLAMPYFELRLTSDAPAASPPRSTPARSNPFVHLP